MRLHSKNNLRIFAKILLISAVLLPEPDEGDGGLLHGAYEALRGAKDGAPYTQRS